MPGISRVFYGWRIVAAICLIMAITSGLMFYNLSVLLNAFVEERGFPVALTSAATAMFFVSGGFAGIVVGRLVDRIDARIIILSGTALGALCLFSVGYLYETWHLFLFHILLGFSHGSIGLVPLTTLVTRWFNAKRSLALSIASTGLSIGGVLVTPFVALSIERGGLHATGPLMTAVLLLGIVPVTLFVLRPSPAFMGLQPDGGVVAASPEAKPFSGSIGYAQARRSRFFLAVSVAYLFLLGTQVAAIAHLYRLANLRDGAGTAAAALAVIAAASIIGRLCGGWILLRVSVRTFALQMMALQGIALLLLAFAQGRMAILAAVALFGVTVGNSLMMHPLLLAEKFGTREYGRIYSVSQFIAMVGYAGGPFIVGAVYGWSGGYEVAFAVCGILTFVGFAILLYGSNRGGEPNG